MMKSIPGHFSLSPEGLFFRYAYVCAEDQMKDHVITGEEKLVLDDLIRQNAAPSRTFAEKCFPDAMKDMQKLSGIAEPSEWTKEQVQKFWRSHQGVGGDCRVLFAQVLETPKPLIAVVKVDDPEKQTSDIYNALNFYNIPLCSGDIVTLHYRVVIEKVE